jgi:hypothetical protein
MKITIFLFCENIQENVTNFSFEVSEIELIFSVECLLMEAKKT